MSRLDQTKIERLAYRLPEFAQMIGVSRAFLYLEQKRGNLTITKIASRSLISRDEAERYARVNLKLDSIQRAA